MLPECLNDLLLVAVEWTVTWVCTVHVLMMQPGVLGKPLILQQASQT